MHVLLQLKSYYRYIEMILDSKKSSDWEAFILNLGDNKDLEKCFIHKLQEELDFSNINLIIIRIWNTFKKHCINFRNTEAEKIASNTIKILSEIFDILFNKQSSLFKDIQKNQYLINLNILVKLKCLKLIKEDLSKKEILLKLKIFLLLINSNEKKVNPEYLKKLSLSEGINLEFEQDIEDIFLTSGIFDVNTTSNFKISASRKNEKEETSSLAIYSQLNEYKEKIKIPTQWKSSEMY
jgi:hypothetical protein